MGLMSIKWIDFTDNHITVLPAYLGSFALLATDWMAEYS